MTQDFIWEQYAYPVELKTLVISITKRYFTSPFPSRSSTSLISLILTSSMSAAMWCLAQNSNISRVSRVPPLAELAMLRRLMAMNAGVNGFELGMPMSRVCRRFLAPTQGLKTSTGMLPDLRRLIEGLITMSLAMADKS